MGSVFHLDLPPRQRRQDARVSALIGALARARRSENDVFWLKENAELLNVLCSAKLRPNPGALAPLRPFYDSLASRLSFFPQYYRFFLSLCLDLEDLGIGGTPSRRNTGAWAVEWVVREGLAETELSDLQRAESRRLCLRRGTDPCRDDSGLDDRLRLFGCRNTTFAIPNKKAAYELTHIVFYLSEYGAKDPNLPESFHQSLRFAGTIAFLEMNCDLLAEVCLALRFAGETPPETWETWLSAQSRRFALGSEPLGWQSDDYHPYLMMQWFLCCSGREGFREQVPQHGVCFTGPATPISPLRELSECLLELEHTRHPDWQQMRTFVSGQISPMAREILLDAEEAVDFEAFFETFARAPRSGARQ